MQTFFAECQRETLDKYIVPRAKSWTLDKEATFVECQHLVSAKLTVVSYKRLLMVLCRESHFSERVTLDKG
jgi:hypothetical protein